MPPHDHFLAASPSAFNGFVRPPPAFSNQIPPHPLVPLLSQKGPMLSTAEYDWSVGKATGRTSVASGGHCWRAADWSRIAGSRVIDIHSHILPEVDDGPKSWDVAVEMCGMAAADGITHIVAAPHANARYAYDRTYLTQVVEQLRG